MEKNTFGNSTVGVATAVPTFVGYTEKQKSDIQCIGDTQELVAIPKSFYLSVKVCIVLAQHQPNLEAKKESV